MAEGQQTEAMRVQLAEQHQAAFGWALGCCNGDAAQAEEVLQCSYLKILEGKACFGGRSSFKTWLFGVIRRTALEYRRRRFLQHLRFVYRSDEAQTDRSDEDVADQVQRQQLQHRFREGLTALPRRQREVMQLVLAHELTLQEASVVMGISVGSVRQHYQRGKQRLRAILGESETT
ncbi:MAG: RNA polymerase sigma factor [Gammaproteobacteria bacterium]|nr:MAG: RNA polymerase sigma factor [Gammaproteobacteria bacterium]